MKILLNKAYKPATEHKGRYRVLYGGSGSGKSHFAAQEILLNMLDRKDYNYLAVRKVSKTLRHSVFRLLTDMIKEYNLSDYFAINKTEMTIISATGSSLITSGLDNVEKLKSISNINRIWIEEASEIDETDFTQLDLRLRGTDKLGYQLTLTFNPISDLHWLKKRFFDTGMPDTLILKTTYKDNHYLDDKYKQTLEELKERDYQYYKIYCLGEWGSIGNLIFSNWEKADLTEVSRTFDNIYNGLDFGFAADSTAFIRVHLDKKHKTLYIFDEMERTEMHIDELAEYISKTIGRERITCDSSEPRSIADLRRHNINATGAKKGPGSIEHGIKWLQGHKIVIDNNCINSIREISGYRYKEDKNGNVIPKPVDIDNHLIDALRYALEEEMTSKSKWGWGT